MKIEINLDSTGYQFDYSIGDADPNLQGSECRDYGDTLEPAMQCGILREIIDVLHKYRNDENFEALKRENCVTPENKPTQSEKEKECVWFNYDIERESLKLILDNFTDDPSSAIDAMLVWIQQSPQDVKDYVDKVSTYMTAKSELITYLGV